jgi:acyl-homoserine-lactone acylase
MDVRAAEQWYRMNKATNKQEFMDAVSMNAIIRFTITYADKEGNISFIDDGMLPVRQKNLDWQQPVRGDTSLHLWDAFYPTDSMPQVHNPSCGWVYNTNNTPYDATCAEDNITPGSIPSLWGFRTGMNNRANRFKELMVEYPKVTFDEMRKIKFDNTYPSNSEFLVSVMDQMNIVCAKPELEKLRLRMINWNRIATLDDIDATLYLVALNYIFKKKGYDDQDFLGAVVIEKEMLEEALQYTHNYCNQYFGSTEVPLGKVQLVKRGDVELPMPGFPDALAANYSKQDAENGKYYG